jgi:transcriptional regulator with XRE-family HTH domain
MARSGTKHRHDDHLGERLRQRRKELGLTATMVARAAGVSPSYLSQREHGKQGRPSLDALTDLAAALDVPLDVLLGTREEGEAAAVEPTLAALSAELGLDAQITAMLGGLHLGPCRPTTREGWLLIWLAIRAACGTGTDDRRRRA